jgi:hypothetical protein
LQDKFSELKLKNSEVIIGMLSVAAAIAVPISGHLICCGPDNAAPIASLIDIPIEEKKCG